MFAPVSGILSTFGAKIKISYAARLISTAVYNDLSIIQAIRNSFAHSAHLITFDTEAIAKDCTQLAAVASARKRHNISIMGAHTKPIDLFVDTITEFTLAFTMKASYAIQKAKFIMIPSRDFFGE